MAAGGFDPNGSGNYYGNYANYISGIGNNPPSGTPYGSSTSTSHSTGSSTSGLLSVSQYAEQLMHDQYAWGQDQFAKNSQLTDQVVGDLMNLYSSLTGVGGQLMSQYQQMFMPEYQNLVQDANNYSSQARIQQAMGAAQSGVNQQFNSQRNAALSDLQSFGIDPSSGRYASLDAAERTQQAAAQAGAGFQAEQATEATGRGLRSEALQLGSVMPSQATAAYNAAQGAATAGENAKLANTQEGANILGTPAQLGSVAQQYRTQQQNSQSNSQSQQYPPSRILGGGNGANPDNRGGGGGGSGSRGGGGGGGSNGPAWGMDMPTGGGGLFDNPMFTGGGDKGTGGQPPGGTDNGPFDWQGGVGLNQTWDPSQMGLGQTDSSSIGGGGTDASGTVTPGVDYTTPLPADTSQTDTSQFDTTSSSSYDDSGSYAKGGAIPVSRSPSRGKVVDDIPARVNQTGEPIRVNAGEHIITKDAVKMKGRKFFDDINKKARGGAIPRSRAYA